MAEIEQAVTAPYDGIRPKFLGRPAYVGAGAAVLGRVTMGKGGWLGAFSVIRADGHYVEIGDDFHLGVHATVHISHGLYPTIIGNRVAAGRNAVIHACTIGDDCVVDRDAIVLDGATIGPGAVVSADAVVYPRSTLEGGWLYAGSPAKPVARVTQDELEAHHHRLRNDRTDRAGRPPFARNGIPAAPDCFLAPTAAASGRITVGADVGIWYGCVLFTGPHRIEIGAGSNVQDNSSIFCETDDVVIGPDVTIGHNVTLIDCRVEANSLIGIGSLLSPGTVVEGDVLVAAGTQTETGQRLTSGKVWAGKPARPIGEMDERKRRIVAGTLPHYRDYAAKFRATRHRALS